MSRLKSYYDRLHENDYKLTPQRKFILETFLKNSEHHLSAEDVYQIVKKSHPEIGLATVYRTLDLLAEVNILQRMDFGDGRTRYEFTNEDDNHHHHHLICSSCGSVQEFDDDLLDSLELEIAKKVGFHIVDHQLKFFGLCEKCYAKNKED